MMVRRREITKPNAVATPIWMIAYTAAGMAISLLARRLGLIAIAMASVLLWMPTSMETATA